MLICNRHSRRGVAQSPHEFSQCRASLRSQYSASVAEVVEPQIRSPSSPPGTVPEWIEVPIAKMPTRFAREQQPLFSPLGVFVQVLFDRWQQVWRYRYVTDAGAAFRR